MAASNQSQSGPDLAAGVALDDIPREGVLAGHVGEDPVLLYWLDGELRAIDGACTHYGGALGEGLAVGETVRCPLHHACFSLRTGEALAAPAFDPLHLWEVEVEGGAAVVRRKLERPKAPALAAVGGDQPRRVVIVGGGAAGFAAAEMLRRKGYGGELTMLSADEAPPCDRPNLSKDYLAGTAPEEWIPLKGPKFYEKRGIDLRLGLEVARIDLDARETVAADGTRFGFDRLLLATGAEPIRLNGPGFDRPNVYTLRSLADSRAIVAAAGAAATVAVVGTSFIGLEAAAALRARGLAVHVVGLDAVPMERTLGRELGALVQSVHEAQGVVFHLGESAEAFDGSRLRLSGGGEIACDFVVLGVGVKPRLGLAAAAGLAVDRGVLVDAFLETSRPGVFAAGDIARYPAPGGGEAVRVEHWVAAERQGQAAAANMLGERRPFLAPPFFWSNHYDLAIRYVGNGTGFDSVEINGSLRSADATVRYLRAGRLVAAASVGRDRENLVVGAELERAAREGGGRGA